MKILKKAQERTENTFSYDKLKEKNIHVETGLFGAEMKVDFINDGPITIILEK